MNLQEAITPKFIHGRLIFWAVGRTEGGTGALLALDAKSESVGRRSHTSTKILSACFILRFLPRLPFGRKSIGIELIMSRAEPQKQAKISSSSIEDVDFTCTGANPGTQALRRAEGKQVHSPAREASRMKSLKVA